MAAKKRLIRPETRNSLGQRLLRAVEISGMNQSEVSEAIGEKRTALGTRIGRLKKNAQDNIELSKIVAYARVMNVSVGWLCAGVGDPWDAPFAIPESSTLRSLPEPARRAIHAAAALYDIHGADAIIIAAGILNEFDSSATQEDWLAAIVARQGLSARADGLSGRGKSTTRARPRRSNR